MDVVEPVHVTSMHARKFNSTLKILAVCVFGALVVFAGVFTISSASVAAISPAAYDVEPQLSLNKLGDEAKKFERKAEKTANKVGKQVKKGSKKVEKEAKWARREVKKAANKVEKHAWRSSKNVEYKIKKAGKEIKKSAKKAEKKVCE